MIGAPVTSELVKAGFEVTALVRDTEKAGKILPKEVKLVKGDLNDKASITEALKDAEGLYINISTRPDDKESDFNPEIGGLDNPVYTANFSPHSDINCITGSNFFPSSVNEYSTLGGITS